MAMFYKIIREKYNDAIQLVYMAEECGSDLYVNSDKEGIYFRKRYMVDCCHNGEYLKEYFESYPEAIDWIRSEYGIDTDKFDSIQEVEAKVEAVNSFNDGDFFNFHRFETEYKYDAERGAA